MDEISKINIFGHNASNKINDEMPQKQQKAEENKKDVKEKSLKKNAEAGDNVLDAMNLAGLVNKAQMVGVKSINPRDYLSEERIKDIEESMGIFEKGVEECAKVIKEEFSQIPLSEAAINALAAQSFILNV